MTDFDVSQLPPAERFELALYKLMRAIHSSIDWQKVSPRTYWDRMPAAFRARSKMAQTFGEMVELLRKSLVIGQFSSASSELITQARALVRSDAEFRQWSTYVQRETTYVAALIRHENDQRKADDHAK